MLYNIVLVSTVHWHESVIDIHISPLSYCYCFCHSFPSNYKLAYNQWWVIWGKELKKKKSDNFTNQKWSLLIFWGILSVYVLSLFFPFQPRPNFTNTFISIHLNWLWFFSSILLNLYNYILSNTLKYIH